MLLYFDKDLGNNASRIHVSTDWYILKTSNKNNLDSLNIHWSKVGETININRILTSFTLNAGEEGYLFVTKHFSNNDTEVMDIKHITDKDFEVLVIYSNVINVEEPSLRVLSNNLHNGGTLDLKFAKIRPRAITLGHITLAIYNSAKELLKLVSSTSYELSIDIDDLPGYRVGERLYLRYFLTSTSRIASYVNETVIIGYDGLPSLLSNSSHVDPKSDYLIKVSGDLTIYQWSLIKNGVVLKTDNGGNMIIPTDTMVFGDSYLLRFTFKQTIIEDDIPTTRKYDVSYPIKTIPRRESYDIHSGYLYDTFEQVDHILVEDDYFSEQEALTTGSLLSHASNVLLKINAGEYGKGLVQNKVIVDNINLTTIDGLKSLIIDNNKFCLIDDDTIWVLKHDYSLDVVSVVNQIPKPNNTFNYTASYNDSKIYTILNSNLVSIDIVSGDIDIVVNVPNSSDISSLVYMGYGKTFIIGGQEAVYVYNESSKGLDLVEQMPLVELSNKLSIVLGMDGYPIFYSNVTNMVYRYIIPTDTIEEISNNIIDENIKQIIRYRNGEIDFIGTTKTFKYS